MKREIWNNVQQKFCPAIPHGKLTPKKEDYNHA
jgi:hypothetical protein